MVLDSRASTARESALARQVLDVPSRLSKHEGASVSSLPHTDFGNGRTKYGARRASIHPLGPEGSGASVGLDQDRGGRASSRPATRLAVVASTEHHNHSSKWALFLIGAALFLVIIVGMIRDILERCHQDMEPRLDGG